MNGMYLWAHLYNCLNHPSLPTSFTVLSYLIKQGISLQCILNKAYECMIIILYSVLSWYDYVRCC